MVDDFKIVKNVPSYVLRAGAIACVPHLIEKRRYTAAANARDTVAVFLIDKFFASGPSAQNLGALGCREGDAVRFITTRHEPSVGAVDALLQDLRASGHTQPCTIVGMGGGCTLDTAKAISNLFTNPGSAANYQGWDLVKNPGVYKIGIPTISGTGAEASRTCVMTNHRSGLKLGMNSDHTLFDQLVLDPDLTVTVERNQYFYTGMDTYIHCVESLNGRYRNAVGDALSRQALLLCREVFCGGDMMSAENRERLMTASYLGGCAIATSFVGVVHPISAGLSVVLGVHHCVANCIAMLALEEFYPESFLEFRSMMKAQGVTVPTNVCAAVTADQLTAMAAAALHHERPLTNALGAGYREVLSPRKLADLYRRM